MTEKEKEKIYLDYKNKVFGYLYGKLNDSILAEDLCSKVFLKVYSNIDRFDSSKASLSTWIYHITKNTLIDYYKKKKNTCELTENIASKEDLDDKICNDEMLETLGVALSELTDRERTIIVLRFYEGIPLCEIAKRLGISYSYCKVLQKDAFEKIKKHFKNI